jgi:4-amino-4-deoxy-L-arabinose transferase-like glycosyltransferase
MDRFSRRLWLGIGVYLLINAISQGLVSGTAVQDQAEQLLLSQSWAFGYGPQPPLYTYLVKLVFLVTGPALWPLLGLKVVLLVLLVGALLLTGRELGFRPDQQLVVVSGLALLPQLIWEAQRDLTHSVLAATVAAWTLLQLLRLARRPSWLNHGLLGILVAAGLLSKYNVAVFQAALLITACTIPDLRRALIRPALAAGILIAALLLTPHLSWALQHRELAMAGLDKTAAAGSLPAGGVISALGAALAFLSPFWLGALALLWPVRGKLRFADGCRAPDQALLQRLPLVVVSLLLVVVLATGADRFKDRWYLTLLFAVPISVASLAPPLPAIRQRWFTGAGIAAAGIAAVLLPTRTMMAGLTGKTSRTNLPLPRILRDVEPRHGQPDLVLSSGGMVGGNARLVFPKALVLTPRALVDGAAPAARPASPGSRVLLLLDRRDDPATMAPLVARVVGPAAWRWRSLAQPFRWAPGKTYTIQYGWLTTLNRPAGP